jgi:WD40 repeat protein
MLGGATDGFISSERCKSPASSSRILWIGPQPSGRLETIVRSSNVVSRESRIMFLRAGRVLLVIGLLVAFATDVQGQFKLPAGARHRLGDGSNPFTSVAFSPDGSLLAVAGYDNWIELWDSAQGKKIRRWETPEGCVVGLAFSPDGHSLASGGIRDSVVHLWNVSTGHQVRDFEGLPQGATSIAFSPDGKYLAAGGFKSPGVYLWEIGTGKPLGPLFGPTVPEQSPNGMAVPFLAYSHVAFAPDGKSLASGHHRGLVRIWDVKTRQEARHFRGPDSDVFVHVGFSADGQTLVSWGESIRAWKMISGTQFVANWGESMGLWKASSGTQLRAFGQQADLRIGAVAMARDGRALASTSEGPFSADNSIHLWETATGTERYHLAGHDYAVSALAFAPDQRTLASASRDGTVILWDVKDLPPGWSDKGYPSKIELEGYWRDLGHSDAKPAYQAIRALIRIPRTAVPFLHGRVSPLTRARPDQLEAWIAALDSKRFATRESAEQCLAMQYELAEVDLRKSLTKDLAPEVYRRLEQTLRFAWDGGLVSQQLQMLRAVEILENIGTTEAKRVLEMVAAGDPGFRITREARISLTRLKPASARFDAP